MSTALLEQRDTVAQQLTVLAEAAVAGALTDEQRSSYTELQAQLTGIDERLDIIEAAGDATRAGIPANPEARSAAITAGTPSERTRLEVIERPMYGNEGQRSFFDDVRRAGTGDTEARARLNAFQDSERDEREARGLTAGTDSAGGFWAAPLDLQQEFIDLRRAAAVAVGIVTNRPLPAGTDTIRLPKMSSGTAAAVHTEGATIQKTDAVLGQVEAQVKRILGGQDVSNFLLDRGVPGIDKMVLADLAADVYEIMDGLVLHGNLTGWQGLTRVAETAGKVVAYTDATPTWGELYPVLASLVAGVVADTKRYPTGTLLAPRRFGWAQGRVDSEGRPLLGAVAPMNAVAENPSAAAEGLRSSLVGVPAYTDGNMRINRGAGTNEDDIITGVMEDAILWTGPLLVGVSTQEKFSTDQTVFKTGIDAAFMANRRDGSFYVAQGTGLIPSA